MRRFRALPTFGLVASAIAVALFFEARPSRADESSCSTYDAEYALAANLKLADTFMGAGDNVFRTGPGKVVLRWSTAGDRTLVTMISYEMHQPFAFSTHVLAWSAQLNSDSTSLAKNSAGAVATGSAQDHSIRWDGPVTDYRVDGTVGCQGSLCGRFGAPEAGLHEVHVPARSIVFKPFELAPDRKTFTMDYIIVAQDSSPKQTTLISVAGREVRRSCVAHP